MTLGKLLFFGGIAGMAVAIILFVCIVLVLKSKKKKLQHRLEEKY